MKNVFVSMAFLMLLAAGVTGCRHSNMPPVDTSGGINGYQQKVLTSRNIGGELDATFDDVWYGTMATLQLNGFILKQANKSSGYIYGVWQNMYEHQVRNFSGGLFLAQISQTLTGGGVSTGGFKGSTDLYRQIEVSVTLEPLAKNQTVVRLSARFDNEGFPVAEGIFANRFFGLLRREIFLRKNGGSIYRPVVNSK